jgi:hypothetical protein
MLNALYYPHTDITNETILKNALLLWDAVETIVPRRGWRPHRFDGNPLLNEAVDLVVRPRVPTDAEREEAHKALLGAIESGYLFSLSQATPRGFPSREYLIYPEKFIGHTWDVLQNEGVATWEAQISDYGVPPAVGLFMMSLLADSCAGTQLQKVTDRSEAYAWLAEQHAKVLGSSNLKGFDARTVAPSLDRLVTLSLEVLDARAIPLKDLITLRRRESSRSGGDLSAMRRRYLEALQAHLKRVGSESRSLSDVQELQHRFREELKGDLHDLKAELNLADRQALFSKEIFVTLLVTAGCLISPLVGLAGLPSSIGATGVIPLAKAWTDYRGSRRTALRKHTMSWLYLAKRSRFQIR